MKLTAAKVAYPRLFKQNDNGKYEVTFTNLSKEDAKALSALGASVRTEKEGYKKEWGQFVVARSKFKPKVIDSRKKSWPEELGIGNGSTVNGGVDVYQTGFPANPIGVGLSVVQVTDLVEFSAGGGGLDEFDEEEGFSTDDWDSEADSDDDNDNDSLDEIFD